MLILRFFDLLCVYSVRKLVDFFAHKSLISALFIYHFNGEQIIYVRLCTRPAWVRVVSGWVCCRFFARSSSWAPFVMYVFSYKLLHAPCVIARGFCAARIVEFARMHQPYSHWVGPAGGPQRAQKTTAPIFFHHWLFDQTILPVIWFGFAVLREEINFYCSRHAENFYVCFSHTQRGIYLWRFSMKKCGICVVCVNRSAHGWLLLFARDVQLKVMLRCH